MKTINIASFLKTGIITLLGCMLLLAGCQEDNGKVSGPDISGEWELVSSSSLTDKQMDIKVYIRFNVATSSFTIYQKLGGGHFHELTGTYAFSGNIMSGTYSDGVAFDCNWEVSIDENTLTMVSSGNDNMSETNVYKRCNIPEDVIKDASDYYPAAKAVEDFRAL